MFFHVQWSEGSFCNWILRTITFLSFINFKPVKLAVLTSFDMSSTVKSSVYTHSLVLQLFHLLHSSELSSSFPNFNQLSPHRFLDTCWMYLACSMACSTFSDLLVMFSNPSFSCLGADIPEDKGITSTPALCRIDTIQAGTWYTFVNYSREREWQQPV